MKHFIFFALGGLLFDTQNFSCSPGSQRPNLPPLPTCDIGCIVSKVDLHEFVAPSSAISALSVQHTEQAAIVLQPQPASDNGNYSGTQTFTRSNC